MKKLLSLQLFFRPRELYNTEKGGLDGFMRGLCDDKIQNFDRFAYRQITKHLME